MSIVNNHHPSPILRALIVESNPQQRADLVKTFNTELNDLIVEAYDASNVEEALEVCKLHHIDFMLLEHELENERGIDLLKKIDREDEQENLRIPYFLLAKHPVDLASIYNDYMLYLIGFYDTSLDLQQLASNIRRNLQRAFKSILDTKEYGFFEVKSYKKGNNIEEVRRSFRDLVCIHVNGEKLTFYLHNNEQIVQYHESLNVFLQRCPSPELVRISRSCAANSLYFDRLHGNKLFLLTQKEPLIVGKAYMEKVEKAAVFIKCGR